MVRTQFFVADIDRPVEQSASAVEIPARVRDKTELVKDLHAVCRPSTRQIDGPLEPLLCILETPVFDARFGGTNQRGNRLGVILAQATALTKQIRIYPLSKNGNPPEMKFVDLYGTPLEMIPKLDGSIYREIHEMIQEEVVLDRDLSMMGLLARIGIKRGEPFKPDAKLQAMFDQAGPEALQLMIEQYHRVLNPWKWEGKKYSELVPAGARETEWSYEFPSFYDYHARGALYYAILSSVKNYGSATYYLDLAETPDGRS